MFVVKQSGEIWKLMRGRQWSASKYSEQEGIIDQFLEEADKVWASRDGKEEGMATCMSTGSFLLSLESVVFQCLQSLIRFFQHTFNLVLYRCLNHQIRPCRSSIAWNCLCWWVQVRSGLCTLWEVIKFTVPIYGLQMQACRTYTRQKGAEKACGSDNIVHSNFAHTAIPDGGQALPFNLALGPGFPNTYATAWQLRGHALRTALLFLNINDATNEATRLPIIHETLFTALLFEGKQIPPRSGMSKNL